MGPDFWKNTLIFPVWNLSTFFKDGEIMVSKYGLMLPGEFPDKVTPDIVFADEAVAQCDIPVIRIPFVSAGNLQIITNKFWFEYLRTVSGSNFAYSFSFLRSWSI